MSSPDQTGSAVSLAQAEPSQAARAEPVSRRWQAVPLLALAALSCYALVTVPVFRDAVQLRFRVGTAQFGVLVSSLSVLGALGAVLASRACDRWGVSRLLRCALGGVGAASLLAAAASQWVLFLLAMAMTSLFTGALALAVPYVLVGWFPRRQRRVLALQLAVTGLAAALYALLAEWLYDLAVGRRAVPLSLVLHGPYYILAGVFLVGAVGVRVGQAAGPADRHRGPMGGPVGQIAFLALLIALHVTSDQTASAWMPRVLGGRSFAVQRIAPGVVAAGGSLAYVVSRLLLAALPDRIGRRAMLVLPGLLGGSVLLAGLASRDQACTAGAFVAASFCWSLEYPIFLAAAAREGQAALARALAWGGLGGAAGTLLLATAMGWVGQTFGEDRLWVILAGPACGFVLVGLLGGAYLRAFGRVRLAPAVGAGTRLPYPGQATDRP